MMKRFVVVAALVAAVPVPSALAADPAPADFKTAAKYCKAFREARGVDEFQTLWGKNANKKNAYGKCVSATAKAKAKKRENAEDDEAETTAATAVCKRQQAENATRFGQDYKNFGQCVKAQKAKSSTN